MGQTHLKSFQLLEPQHGELRGGYELLVEDDRVTPIKTYAYLDAMLDKSAQEAFAIGMGYNPTVTNAAVAPDLNRRIGLTPEEIEALVDLDHAYMTQNDVALKEWWDKELKG